LLRRAQRNGRHRQGIAGKNVGILAAGDRLADFQTHGRDDVALLAVYISNERNIRRPIRIVFDLRHASRHAVLITLEIDHPIEALVAATTATNRNPAIVVATRNSRLALEQRLPGDRTAGPLASCQIRVTTP